MSDDTLKLVLAFIYGAAFGCVLIVGAFLLGTL